MMQKLHAPYNSAHTGMYEYVYGVSFAAGHEDTLKRLDLERRHNTANMRPDYDGNMHPADTRPFGRISTRSGSASPLILR